MLVAARATYATERLSDALWAELEPLLAENEAEVPHFVEGAPVAPSRDLYAKLQDAGALRVYTARDESGALIGYLAVGVSRSFHQPSVVLASLDVLYVAPAFRGTATGAHLIRHAHRDLRSIGVSALYQSVKHGAHSIGALLRWLGYRQVEEVWAINLDERE